MRITPRALGATLVSLAATGVLVAACTDAADAPVGPDPKVPEPVLELRCTGDVASRTMRCAGGSGSGTDASGDVLIVGGQGQLLQVRTSAPRLEQASVGHLYFMFDLTVQNLMRQPLGTADTASFAPHPDGLRVFFHDRPTATSGSGTIDVLNATDSATFTRANQPYFQYDSVSRGGVEERSALFQGDTSASKVWTLHMPETVTTFSFSLYVAAEVPFPDGWVDATVDTLPRRRWADTVQLEVGDSVRVLGLERSRVGNVEPDVPAYTSGNPAAASVSASGMVRGLAPGEALVYATTAARPAYRRTLVRVVPPVPVDADSAFALENVARPVPAPGLLANDDPGFSVVADSITTAAGGTALLNPDGSYLYLSAPGVAGRDSFVYQATDGSATHSAQVLLRVEDGRIWFVRGEATGGTGTDRHPFGTIGAAQAVAEPADSILVLEGPELDEQVILEEETLIGAGITGPLTHTLGDGTVITKLPIGPEPVIAYSGTGSAVLLGFNNTLRGLGITAAAGAGIAGGGFGTLTTSRIALNPRGPALYLEDGFIAADLEILSSDSSAQMGLHLYNVHGTLSAARGRILDPAGLVVDMDGTSGDFAFGDSIRSTRGGGIRVRGHGGGVIRFTGAEKTLSTGANPAVSLSNNSESTTIRFAGGGLVIRTTDGGLGFGAGGGTVEVTGAGNTITTTNRPAIGMGNVDTGVAGLSFASITTGLVTDPAGPSAIRLIDVTGAGIQAQAGSLQGLADIISISGGNLDFRFGGAVTQANSGSLISIFGGHSGEATFTGTLSATAGTGLIFADADGAYRFHGTTTLNGGNAGIDILSGSTGYFEFGRPAPAPVAFSVVNPSGEALRSIGSAPTVEMNGTLEKSSPGRLVSIRDAAGGTFNFRERISNTAPAEPFELFDSFVEVAILEADMRGTLNVGVFFGYLFLAPEAELRASAEEALRIRGGAPDIEVHGPIQTTGTASPIAVDSLTGGTVTLRGPVTTTGGGVVIRDNTGGSVILGNPVLHLAPGTGPGILLEANTGTAVTIAADSFRVVTTDAPGIQANGGGTVEVIGEANSIETTGGAAIDLRNTTIGSGGLNFRRVNRLTGTGPGIILSSTGTAGGLTITGDGGTGSGGTSQTTTTSVALDLRLARAELHDYLLARGAGRTTVQAARAELTLIDAGVEGGITADSSRLTIQGGTNGAITAEMADAAALLSVLNGTIQLQAVDSAASNVRVTGSAGTVTIAGTVMSGASGDAVSVQRSGAGTLNVRLSGNQVGEPGTANSGSSGGGGISIVNSGPGTLTSRIAGNTVLQVNGETGILLQTGGGAGILNGSLIDNTIQEPGTAPLTRDAIRMRVGTASGDAGIACIQAGAAGEENSIAFGGNRVALNQAFSTTVRLPGYAGGQFDTGAVEDFLESLNDASSTPTGVVTSSGAGGGFQNTTGGAACPQPPE